MKKLIVIAAIAALSACGERAEEAPAAEDTAAAAPAGAETGVAAGTYDATAADGTAMGKTVINADGTYEDIDKDGKVTKGTYVRRDGKDCFDEEGDVAEICWTVTAPGADGSFTATHPDGKTVLTIKPSVAAAPAASAPAAPAPVAT